MNVHASSHLHPPRRPRASLHGPRHPDAAIRRPPRPPAHLLFDPVLAAKVVRTLRPLLRTYFRGEVRGLERVPPGQTIVVANHDGGMLPIDALLFGSEWHQQHAFQRRLHFLVHDAVLAIFGPWKDRLQRLGCVLADRVNLDAALDSGHSVFIYPGGSRETFRSWFDRKTLTLGHRTGFIKHSLRRRVPITPVVSVGAHETFVVLWRGAWIAERLGLPRRFRADVFPIVAGLPFGVWMGAGVPHFPLPAKLTLQVLPPIDLHGEVTARLGRELRPADLEDQILLRQCFERVRGAMQDEMDRLYRERKYPIIG